MRLFRKAWEHPEAAKRKKGVAEKLTDQDTLIKIASTDSNLDVRLAAIPKIKSELFLAQLVNTIDNSSIRYAALKNINSLDIVVPLFMTTTFEALASNLVEKMPKNLDQPSLMAIVQQAGTRNAQLWAANQVQDGPLLSQLVRDNRYEAVRIQGAQRLSDKALLRELMTAKSEKLAQTAAKRFVQIAGPEDAAFLAQIAAGGADGEVRKLCIQHTTDKRVIQRLMDSEHYGVQVAAVRRMIELAGPEDEELLMGIAKVDQFNQGQEAMKKINRQDLLQRLYRESELDRIREAALTRITDVALLEGVAQAGMMTCSRLAQVAYKQLPYYDAEIQEHLRILSGGAWAKKKEAAQKLGDRLKAHPESARLFWRGAAKLATTTHKDEAPHSDNGADRSRNNDCTHSDYHPHTDTGVGVSFPPYPFGDA